MAVDHPTEAYAGAPPGAALVGGPAVPITTLPNTAEGLLADRQVVWGNFTRIVLWSTIVVAASLIVIVWAVL